MISSVCPKMHTQEGLLSATTLMQTSPDVSVEMDKLSDPHSFSLFVCASQDTEPQKLLGNSTCATYNTAFKNDRSWLVSWAKYACSVLENSQSISSRPCMVIVREHAMTLSLAINKPWTLAGKFSPRTTESALFSFPSAQRGLVLVVRGMAAIKTPVDQSPVLQVSRQHVPSRLLRQRIARRRAMRRLTIRLARMLRVVCYSVRVVHRWPCCGCIRRAALGFLDCRHAASISRCRRCPYSPRNVMTSEADPSILVAYILEEAETVRLRHVCPGDALQTTAVSVSLTSGSACASVAVAASTPAVTFLPDVTRPPTSMYPAKQQPSKAKSQCLIQPPRRCLPLPATTRGSTRGAMDHGLRFAQPEAEVDKHPLSSSSHYPCSMFGDNDNVVKSSNGRFADPEARDDERTFSS
ncbi:uncharacterized protein IWZ02DRAFT_190358 [Phyllosticta citriasiana]|uniref:uncharacterized protein n=1 Tax=Phyllosticta citriasiana TaxID=595635 RepID=UPI0030FD9C35